MRRYPLDISLSGLQTMLLQTDGLTKFVQSFRGPDIASEMDVFMARVGVRGQNESKQFVGRYVMRNYPTCPIRCLRPHMGAILR